MTLNEREAFEALPEIKAHLDHGNAQWSDEHKTYVSDFKSLHMVVCYLRGAWMAWQEKAKAQAVPEGYVLLPTKITPEINEILGMQCFQFIRAAQVYRGLGFEINKKAEDEQAFFLFKFLHLALEHGDKYLDEFNAETRKLLKESESGAEG